MPESDNERLFKVFRAKYDQVMTHNNLSFVATSPEKPCQRLSSSGAQRMRGIKRQHKTTDNSTRDGKLGQGDQDFPFGLIFIRCDDANACSCDHFGPTRGFFIPLQ
jgi:hypothetical protein